MFRYERPQAGRQRQFHQIGLEFLGLADPRSDVEGIVLAWDLLAELGVGGLCLEINSLGDHDDRVRYRAALVAYLEQRREQLDPDSQQRLISNPLRILDAKDAGTQAVLEGAPSLLDTLGSASRARFDQVLTLLTQLGIPFRLNPRLVRGLDYYGHTAFEITSSQLGAQATVCGGGRYDGLVGQLGGPATPAFGWALGMERLVLLVAAAGSELGAARAPDLYVISRGEAAEALALGWARKWRLEGLAVELDLSGAAFGKQFKRADNSGARWAAVIGDSEAAEGVVLLKDLRAATGASADRRVAPEDVASRIHAQIDRP
jgi:histidyl-tRNA synthetase